MNFKSANLRYQMIKICQCSHFVLIFCCESFSNAEKPRVSNGKNGLICHFLLDFTRFFR